MSLTGPHGTPFSSSTLSQCAAVLVRKRFESSASSSLRCAMRSLPETKRGSLASSVASSASSVRAQLRWLAPPITIHPSDASKA